MPSHSIIHQAKNFGAVMTEVSAHPSMRVVKIGHNERKKQDAIR